MANSMRFGDDVAKAIGSKSQRKLAQEMGVSQTTVGNMLMGRIPSEEIIRKFAKAIGEDPEVWLQKTKFYETETFLRKEWEGMSDADIDRVREIVEKYRHN